MVSLHLSQVCLVAAGYFSTVYVGDAPSDGAGAQWSAKERYGEQGEAGGRGGGGEGGRVDEEEVGLGDVATSDRRLEPPGFWAAADVRSASSLPPEEFKRDYMLAGKPVIIRGDPGALALAAKLNVDTLLSMCGDHSPDLGNRISEVIKTGIPKELKQAINARLQETDGISLRRVIDELDGRGSIKTLRDFFSGEHFTAWGGRGEGAGVDDERNVFCSFFSFLSF